MNDVHSYRLYLNHCLSVGGKPALLDSQGLAGPFHQSTVLPGITGNSSAYDVVLRKLARSPRETDPDIDCEPGLDADRTMLDWLRIDESEIARSLLIAKLVNRIGKPSVVREK